MNNPNYEKDRVTIQYPDRFHEIPEWNKFQEEKQKIRDKYPNKPWEVHISSGRGNHKDPYNSEWWEDWQNYKKEITDLLLKPNGNFDKFKQQLVAAHDELKIKTWLRGRYNTDTYKKKG